MPYIGKSANGFGIRERYRYSASGSQTAFTGSDLNSKTLQFDSGSLLDVYLNGVLLDTADYNTSTANTVTLTSGATASDEVMIVVYDVFSLSDAMPKTGGTFSGAVTANNTLDMNGTELILDADGDSSIHSSTDDQIDIKVGGTDTLVIEPDGMTLRGPHPAFTLTDTDDSNSGGVFYNNGQLSVSADFGATGATGIISFQIDGNEDVKIDGGGDLTITDGNLVIGTAGKGIDFSVNTASSVTGTSNQDELLDHYEEGYFTPTIYGSSGSAGSQSLINQEGRYVKVGKLVYITLYLVIANGGAGSWSGTNRFGGLPFTNGAANRQALSIGADGLNGDEQSFTISGSSAFGHVVDMFTGAGVNYSSFVTGYSIQISGCYYTT